MSIYDISGQLIRTLINQTQSEGQHSMPWNGKSENGLEMNNGTYIILIESNGETANGKLMLER